VESVASFLAWINGNIIYHYIFEFYTGSGQLRKHSLPSGKTFYDFINQIGVTDQTANEVFMNDASNWSVLAGYWQWIHFCYILMVVLSAVKIVLYGFFGTELFSKIFKFFYQAAMISSKVIKT
jgi:hypothetical protein